MIQYNTPIVMECIEMTGQCRALTGEIRADATATLGGSVEHFRGGGAEGFQEDYTAEMSRLDQLEEMIGRAEAALGMSMEGMQAKDAQIRASYGG
ncbi:MAG: hypothetical protein K0U78_20275 [Actinomycetia bacterium]|nr:hypothetical protein [Actinomycetes bacterium]